MLHVGICYLLPARCFWRPVFSVSTDVKSTGYPLHSPVSPSLPLPCVTVCHHISTGLYACACYGSCQHSDFKQFYAAAHVRFMAVTEVTADIRFDRLAGVLLKHVTLRP